MRHNCKMYIVLGLLLILGSPAMAIDEPVPPGLSDVLGPLDLSTGKLKSMPPRFPELSRTDARPFTEPPLPLGKAADMCEDDRTSGLYWFLHGSVFDGAIFFAYQDIETVCPSPSTVQVYSASVAMVSHGAAGMAAFHAEVWSVDDSDPLCPVPLAPVYIGPTISRSIPAGTAGIELEIPLAASPYDITCVDGPYFIAIVPGPQEVGVELGIWASNDVTTPQYCTWYWKNIVSTEITDFAEFFWDGVSTLDLNISSFAQTSAQNDCYLPGDCRWNYYHCAYEVGASDFALPSISGTRDFVWSKFTAMAPCSIMQVDAYAGAVRVGDPGFRISIFDDDNGYPGDEIVGEDFPSGAAGLRSAYFAADQPVIVPIGYYYVHVGRASWATDADTVGIWIAPPGTCDIVCGSGVTGNDGTEITFCDLYGAGGEYNVVTEVYTCCPPNPCCDEGAGEDDIWFTHAHDYARTSRSEMGISGEPCDIALNWKRNTIKTDARFNNVSVAGGKVFYSDDQSLSCYDLAFGTVDGTPGGSPGPVWTYFDPAGIATAGAMRNNVTVYNGYVYGSGGTAQSFFKLDTLGNLQWSRHYNSHGNGVADMLRATLRFSVSVVVGDKVIVGTEGGLLYCLNTADGTNHTDWTTNPIDLGDVIFHSPAYDGIGNLYVATALDGDIYKVSLSDGTPTLIFTEPDGDGFYSGVSYDPDENVLYAASIDGTGGGDTPMRFKLAIDGTVIWQKAQGNVLYAPPAIGYKKVYFGQDNPASGVLVVDKFSGMMEYNFANDGVGMVTNPLTLTADCLMFAGDRQGDWHLVNPWTGLRIWSRHFQDYVWGTALAHHDLEDKDYAVMSIWSDVTTGYALGAVFCWELNATPRPMLEQYVDEVNIPVPFGSGPGNPVAAPDAFANVGGCGPLAVSALNVYDNDPPLISELRGKVTKGNPKSVVAAAKAADKLAGDDYLSFFAESRANKIALMNGAPQDMDRENYARHQSKIRFDKARKTTQLAAGTQMIRTSNVALDVALPITGGTKFGLTWDWDGTGLERSIASDYIEVVNDDPDFYPEAVGMGYYPGITVNYIGGCLYEWFEDMWWNGYEMWHKEQVSNFGRTGVGDPAGHPVPGLSAGYGLDWGNTTNAGPLYDGGFILAQVGADHAMTTIYDQSDMIDRLLPNPGPISGVCGIDYADYVPMGRSVVVDWNHGGGCPPVRDVDYLDVEGEVSWVSFIDSAASLDYTLGTEITQVEISMYDFGSGYGNFKLYHYKVHERNGHNTADLVAGMFHDWDVESGSSRNAVVIVPEVGGYAVWDSGAPNIAFGQLVLGATPSTSNSARVDGAAYRALVGVANGYSVYAENCVRCCVNSDLEWMDCIDNYWLGAFIEDDAGIGGPHGDKSGLFLWPGFALSPNGEQHLYCATFGVDATSNDRGIIEENIRDMAFRANKWAGFARGDVNDDNIIDVIDVAYLYGVTAGASGWPVFPYDETQSVNGGNGDVDGNGTTDPADFTYLLSYLMGGPPPVGAWRFGFMP